MADPVSQVREPEILTVLINSGRNLRGSRGEALTAALKVEFNGNVLGESQRVECQEGADAEFDFSTTYSINFEDVNVLDELAHKPIIVTLIEILPKEKKQKEEKSMLLGQVSLDVMPMLFENVTTHSQTLQIHALPGSAIENLAPELPKLELDVTLSVNRPLVSDSETNVLAITLENLFSPPDSWNPSQQQYTYSITTPMPFAAPPNSDEDVQEAVIAFPSGVLKSAHDKEALPRAKKWLTPGPNTQGNAVYIPDNLMPEAPTSAEDYEDEDGELKEKQDGEWRLEVENNKNRVAWNTERRCLLQPQAVSKVQTQIATSRYWPFEIWRVQQPKEVKTKKDDENPQSFHGIAYVNMAKLLYPGIKKIRGAFKVHPYNESEFLEKTKRGSRVDTRPGSGRQSPGQGGAETSKKDATASNKLEKPATGTKEPPSSQDKQRKDAGGRGKHGKDDEEGVVDHEAQQYEDACSYIVVEIELIRPLVPKKDSTFLVQSVAKYIPPRPRFPLRLNGADKAVEDFHCQVVSVVNLVLEQYRDLFSEEIANGSREQTAEGMKQRYQTLIYELNTSGKYFAFREQLKYSVIKIVREKYLRTTNFESQDELQKFLSELYVFLVDEMHKGLAKVLTLEDQTPVPEALTDADQLKHFARESEMNNNMKLADQFYLERISRNRKDPSYWFDYACFNLLNGDIPKAVESTKECVANDQQNLQGLLLYGILMLLDEKLEEAEIFLEAATNFYPESVEAWTILGLYYDSIGNDIGHEMAIEEAAKMNLQATIEEYRRRQAEEAEAEDTTLVETTINADEKTESVHGGTMSPADDSNAVDGVAATSGEDLNMSQKNESGFTAGDANNTAVLDTSGAAASGPTGSANAARRSTLISAGKQQPAQSPSQTKKKKDGSRNQTPLANKNGDANTTANDETSDENREKEEIPKPEQSIYMRTANFLLDLNALKLADRALSHELTSVTQGGGDSTVYYHLALARLNLQWGNLVQAEKAARQAIALDFKSGEAWSLDGHINYVRGQTEEARVSYERVLSFSPPSPQMHPIYLRLASIYLKEGRFEDAKCTYLLACRDSPSCLSWHGVGVACYRLGSLSEAEDALCEANILNNRDPQVWAYLTLVCLQTGREYEAEQSYKYALKVGLDDEDLLNEIRELQKTVGFGDPSF